MAIKSPYETLGVSPTATDAELRTAYRRLVQLHHPDHNQNSPESTRRFEAVQAAYAQVLRERMRSAPPRAGEHAEDLDARLKDLERQVRDTQAARERARRAAREAMAAAQQRERPTDEELGYVTTEDSFTQILIDGLEELASKLDRSSKP